MDEVAYSKSWFNQRSGQEDKVSRWRNWICFPAPGAHHLTNTLCWFRINPTCFDHKKYPICKCGRKYVPINKNDKQCFFCMFLSK